MVQRCRRLPRRTHADPWRARGGKAYCAPEALGTVSVGKDSSVARRDDVAARVRALVYDFDRYVMASDSLVPFSPEQLAAHRATIALRQRASSVSVAVGDPDFVHSLRRTLIAWRLDSRASKLAPGPAFGDALAAALPKLVELEPYRIDAGDWPDDLVSRLWTLIETLGVVTNDAKLVAGTKTLHHLLPDLVPPMDRAWTGKFFGLHAPEWQGASQRRTFFRLYGTFRTVAQQVDPLRHVTGDRWRTSRTKILDNALIGYCALEMKPDAVREPSVDRGVRSGVISFRVSGYPPAKNEALSMLGEGHTHSPRVRALLAAARDALAAQPAFEPIAAGRVGLEVVLQSAGSADPWDATNYLGGIADVLEDKSGRGAVRQDLGELAAVWLYRNDRQIRQVAYREEPGVHGYHVTIRALDR
jgi:hypothetical protein